MSPPAASTHPSPGTGRTHFFRYLFLKIFSLFVFCFVFCFVIESKFINHKIIEIINIKYCVSVRRTDPISALMDFSSAGNPMRQ